MLAATLLLPEFEPYLAPKEEFAEEDDGTDPKGHTKTEKEILEDMQKLGM